MKISKTAVFFAILFLFSTLLPARANSWQVSWLNWKALEEKTPKTLILATTTSVNDTGLLDVLLPIFIKESGIQVKTLAVGSGQAMALGEKGEADILLVHSPQAEEKFMAAGFGIDRKLLMHNFFMIAGPKSDPAGIKESKTACEAFSKIFKNSSLFVSRGDESGTHVREKALWQAAGLDPVKKSWYQSTGSGMGATLNIASEKAGYVLTDRATFLALRGRIALEPMVEGDPALKNLYHVILLNPKKFPKVNEQGAQALASFLFAPETKRLIGRFGTAHFGEPLFYPEFGK
ncbi:MAG TPA: substrate-binding domain-containing protein [Chroococcales cyanobacterium]|jgi:tungstate transport system substrate-binding protein